MSGEGTSDEEGSQEDSARYDVDDMEIIKTIGKTCRPLDDLDDFFLIKLKILSAVCLYVCFLLLNIEP